MSVLTEADKERIRELAGEGMRAHRIAKLIGRNGSTVNWFMYSDGLIVPKQIGGARSYIRNGREVHLFTVDEDAFIEHQRRLGSSFVEIAKLHKAAFGIERRPTVIRNRLVMLASIEDAA